MDDRCPASGRWFHRVAGDVDVPASDEQAMLSEDQRYATSDPGDEGDVVLHRGEDTFLVTVENVTGEFEDDDGR